MYVVSYVVWLWASPCPDLYISGAIYSNAVYLPQCLILICAIACPLYRARKHSHPCRTWPHMFPVMWTGFQLHPVWIVTFPEQYIVIMSPCQHVILLAGPVFSGQTAFMLSRV